jgi:LuxR family transcriptional regulator, maltose regulon positive regulatory protein
MEPAITSLILTKLRPPAARSRTVHRARLLEKLTPDPEIDLILFCAPAGYGKTTLMVEWLHRLHQDGTAVAWYALDESDNSPNTFGSYLVSSLLQAIPAGSGLEAVCQVLRATPEVDFLTLLPAVINAICGIDRDILLALDDYHIIRAPAIHQAVEFIIQHRPSHLHIAIGSRANPPLPLARLRAKGRLIELRAGDLRFTTEETDRFLRDSMQLELPESISSQLTERVEGWAAGLQLAALSLSGRPGQEYVLTTMTGGHKRLVEYLLEEVINQLSEALQSFLLYTSILERLSGPSCDAILNREDSAALLQQLEQSNLFLIPLDEAGVWYRYHHLFRDFLLTWLARTQPEQAAALHRAAVGWYANQGSLREAAHHALRSGDWSFAADFVEQHCATLIIQSEIATIYEWTSAFPEVVIRSRPRLCIYQALALAYRYQARHRPRVEARLEQAYRALANMDNPDQALEVSELGAVVHSLLAMIPDPAVDAQAQLKMANERLSVYPSGAPGRFPWLLITGYALLALNQPDAAQSAFEEALPLALEAGLFFGYVETTFHMARLAQSQGRLTDSFTICQDGQTLMKAVSVQHGLALPALGCLSIAAGCILLEQDRLEEAEQYLRQGLEQMGLGMNPYYLLTAYLALFRLHEMLGQWDQAAGCLDQLEALWPDVKPITQAFRVDAMLREKPGDEQAAVQAREWLQSYHSTRGDNLPLPGLGPIAGGEAYYQADLIWTRLQIELSDPQAVQPRLDQQLQIAQAHGLVGRALELKLVQAQFLYRQGDEEQALVLLKEAISVGRPQGYARLFDQGLVLDELLHQAALQGLAPNAIDRILSTIRSSRRQAAGAELAKTPGGLPAGEMVESLSERELEVLHMIASGAANQTIADRFVITVGTVKSHIHHIFEKLNVRNRTEAVARARNLGLIKPK